MSLLLISEIRDGLTPPEFGGEFAAHIARKTNPAVRAASLTAWNLLAEGLVRLGRLPQSSQSFPGKFPAVRFGERGKPEFIDCPLHFSLAHSGKLAVALLSEAPCGVDIEGIRPEVSDRLRARCLSPEELRLGPDFFECWTKKECVGKMTGEGIDAHPAKIDTLDPRWADRFFSESLTDSSGQSYALAALCEDIGKLEAVRL